eukprot:1178179-Prorocentrum_minimum.AAC.3
MAKHLAILNPRKAQEDRRDRFFEEHTYTGGKYGNRLFHLPPSFHLDGEIRHLDGVPGLGANGSWMIGGRAVQSLNGLSMSYVDPALWGPAARAPRMSLENLPSVSDSTESLVPPLLPSLRNPTETHELPPRTPNPRPLFRMRSKYSEQHNRHWTNKMLPHMRHLNPRQGRNCNLRYQPVDIYKVALATWPRKDKSPTRDNR